MAGLARLGVNGGACRNGAAAGRKSLAIRGDRDIDLSNFIGSERASEMRALALGAAK
jgi:hypothetical protein